jgi:hypothetical protein
MSYSILYGDIHNHNAHGYGVGSIERSLEIARTHLDFFAFTGHSSWHDMPAMEGRRERHWIEGFKCLKDTWPRVQQVIAAGNREGEFCAFLGFEWHSSSYGDQCVVFPGDHRPLHYAGDIEGLRAFCVEEKALMIPHHLAYPKGMRGVNWDVFREDCSPVAEIYSEHGNSEHDRGPYDFFSHSMGGRETAQTARAALDAGLRFGFVGSSDNHAGFPGAYGEGLMGALVTDFSRAGILDAIRARRTYALSGDRVEVDFRVNGAPMGSTIEAGADVEVAFGSARARRARSRGARAGRPHRAPCLSGAERILVREAFPGAPRMGLGSVGSPRARAHLRLVHGRDAFARPDCPLLPLPAIDAFRRGAPSPLRAPRRARALDPLLHFAQERVPGEPQPERGARARNQR